MRRALARVVVLLLLCNAVALAVRLTEPGDDGDPAAAGQGPGTTAGAGGGVDGGTAAGSAPPGGGGPSTTAGRATTTAVTGTATALAVDAGDGGAVPVPLTIATGRASIRGALVGGQRATIDWDGGRPLALSGDGGGIALGAAHLDVDPAGAGAALDGPARRLLPGTYRTTASVAVGTAGLARPVDGVTFVADGRTTIVTRDGATARTGPRPLRIAGPGRASLSGLLLARTPAGLRSVTAVVFGPGPFDLSLRPQPGGYDVTGTLRGPVDLR